MSVQTKMTAIADAIRRHSGKTDALSLEGMASEINSFHTFTPPDSVGAAPEEIYRTTRPADWLPLPVPGDEEMYFLGHLEKDIDNQFLIKLTFTGTCTVEFGNLSNGIFVAKETVSPVSDTMLYHTLNYHHYGDETANGYRQYIVRISGSKITNVRGGINETDNPACIVDFVCGIPLSLFSANGSQANGNWNKTFASTRYIRFVGNGKPGVLSFGFMYCTHLQAIACERKNDSEYASYTFAYCRQLHAISANLLPALSTSCTRSFRDSALSRLPVEHLSVTDGSFMFANASLEAFDGSLVDTSTARNMSNLFDGCFGLQKVEKLDISALTNNSYMFRSCTNLQKLTFAGASTPGGITLDMQQTALGHTALVNMLSSLPPATKGAVIIVTNNPGAAGLTDAEIAEVTAKNWTVTV